MLLVENFQSTKKYKNVYLKPSICLHHTTETSTNAHMFFFLREIIQYLHFFTEVELI